MAHMKRPPALATLTASKNVGLRLGIDTQDIAPKPAPAQAISRDLLRDDIVCNVSAMMANLDVALASAAVPDDVGLIYALRRCRAYWRAISGSAAELVSAEAERQSALLQGADQ